MMSTNNDPSSSSSIPPITFPPIHSFPPFYTLQRNDSTLVAQLSTWSALIQHWCRHHRIFRLSISESLGDSELFYNRKINRRLKLPDIRRVLEYMRDKENTAEVVSIKDGGGGGGGFASIAAASSKDKDGGIWWVWWRGVEEWSGLIETWVEETGQKNTVLTLYELTQGEMTRGTEFHGMDTQVLQKALGVLVKRGKAQVFGGEDAQGVKFF